MHCRTVAHIAYNTVVILLALGSITLIGYLLFLLHPIGFLPFLLPKLWLAAKILVVGIAVMSLLVIPCAWCFLVLYEKKESTWELCFDLLKAIRKYFLMGILGITPDMTAFASMFLIFYMAISIALIVLISLSLGFAALAAVGIGLAAFCLAERLCYHALLNSRIGHATWWQKIDYICQIPLVYLASGRGLFTFVLNTVAMSIFTVLSGGTPLLFFAMPSVLQIVLGALIMTALQSFDKSSNMKGWHYQAFDSIPRIFQFNVCLAWRIKQAMLCLLVTCAPLAMGHVLFAVPTAMMAIAVGIYVLINGSRHFIYRHTLGRIKHPFFTTFPLPEQPELIQCAQKDQEDVVEKRDESVEKDGCCATFTFSC